MPDFYRLKPPRWSSASSTSCPALAQQDSRALLVLGFVLFVHSRRRPSSGGSDECPDPHPCTPVPRRPLRSVTSSGVWDYLRPLLFSQSSAAATRMPHYVCRSFESPRWCHLISNASSFLRPAGGLRRVFCFFQGPCVLFPFLPLLCGLLPPHRRR